MVDEIKTFEQRKQELVNKGKEKGFITYEELAASLKGLDLDADSLDDLYNAFNENNIAIISAEDYIKAIKTENPNSTEFDTLKFFDFKSLNDYVFSKLITSL